MTDDNGQQDGPHHGPLPRSSLEILLTLARGSQHGYGIKHAVEQRTDGSVRLGAGTLYTALQRLEEQGLIHEVEEGADPELGGSRWRFYAITDAGLATLRTDLRALEKTLRTARSLDLLPKGSS